MARVSAIIIKDDKILLIHRVNKGDEYYVYPGGHVEAEETPLEAVKREVKEETNLNVLTAVEKLNYKTQSDFAHYAFICEVADGEVKLIGEEKDRNTKEDSYSPEWIEIKKIKKLKVYPEEVTTVLKDSTK